NSMGSFFMPALAPALSNLTFIAAAPFLAARWGVYGLSTAVLCGGAVHFVSQWLWGFRLGAPLLPGRPNLGDPDLRRMMALFLPYAAGLSLNQVNPVISRMLGSFLQEGTISVLNYANRILQLPLGLFVIAVSQAVLPQLSRAREPEDFAETLRHALRFTLFIVLPASAGLILISRPFVHLVFVRGAFGEGAWEATATCLSLGMLGLPGMACSTVVMRGLYALSLPRAAFATTLFSVASTALLSLFLMPMGYAGLALAPSVAFTLSGMVGLGYVRRRLGRPLGVLTGCWTSRIAASLALLILVTAAYGYFLPYAPAASLGRRALWCLGVILAGTATYASATLTLRCEEWLWIREAVGRRKENA
ncbi:lipid II flippase MurJ, partial [uncultured Fretibacterium sp.]|uniref:murein biosynthesis integral membrane protein MurJ n=1 Tax=uncultured Fretibacterium sp. TaxID=1678694 RepID=UPI00325FA298